MNQDKARKQAEKLLADPIGRKELGKMMGVTINPTAQNGDKPEPPPERPIVALLVPVYDHPEPQMQSAIAQLLRYSMEYCDVYPGPELQGSSVIHWARNFLIAELIKTQKPWTHVLFMDDDIVPPKDALVKMLSHKKDIVGAVCTKRIDPPLPNIMHCYENENGIFFRGIQHWPENELIEVGAIGTGMILISRHALEQIADVYFEAKYEKEAFGISDEIANRLKIARLRHFDKTANAFWFRFLGGMSGADEYGEDISFSFVAKRYAGITVFADTSIQPGHIGKYPYSIADFIQQRDMLAKMRENGEWKIPDLQSDMKISICCPTRGRPERLKEFLQSIEDTAAELPQVILRVDDDDTTELPEKDWVKVIRGPRKTLSDLWNDCAQVAKGDILMFAGDDIRFQTKHWDKMIINTFESHPDKYIFVHGDDGHFGSQFGTHGFVHRKWYETLGYLLPPYFSSDYGDTWLNDMSNLLQRRVYLNFVTEHMHPIWNKGEWDQTHRERLQRHQTDDPGKIYADMRPKLMEDADKIREAIRATKIPEPELIVG